MSSPEATSDLTCRLNDVRSSLRHLEHLQELAHAGGVVHPLAHQREHLIA